MLTHDAGNSLLIHFRTAIAMSAKHEALFSKFSSNFSNEIVEKWEKIVRTWEEDPTSKNPFFEASVGELSTFDVKVTIINCGPGGANTARVRLDIANEEMSSMQHDQAPTHDVSPYAFLQIGLDLEEQQYV